ncbi:MAG: hypothetical protein DRI24_21865 [Deltaproteobacteria bacterium]|nr:MAG: hypothetical protein DRI24_21865 [Deltaproteobacteria bacterium]
MTTFSECEKALDVARAVRDNALRKWLEGDEVAFKDIGTLLIYGVIKTKDGFFLNEDNGPRYIFKKTDTGTTK